MAILQSMTSREHQQAYIDSLEESLLAARLENNDLVYKLKNAVKANVEKSTIEGKFSVKDDYNYLTAMLEQSQ